jgi:hypothetical protein
MTHPSAPLSRRQFLRRVVTGLQFGGAAALLAACRPGALDEPPAQLPAVTPISSAEAQTAAVQAAALRDLDLAPPAMPVDSLLAVPIDIHRVDARIVFDAAARAARADATMIFTTGDEAGAPIFDLRQEVREAFLDDQPLDPQALRHRDLGGGADAELRVVEQILPAGSAHQLRLAYDLSVSQSPEADVALLWDDQSRLYWDFWFSDLWPARYLEMWLPANLIYDRFTLNLEIEIANASAEHVLISNGAIRTPGANSWRVAFPPRFTALSPMLLVVAKDQIETRNAVMQLPDTGADLRLEMIKLVGAESDLVGVEQQLREFIAGNVMRYGPYMHGERFTAYIWNGPRSMEYEGGVTSSVASLEHEVFHSWFARGVKPASQNDGWIDEGWTVYNTDPDRFAERPFGADEMPGALSSANPYNRVTPRESYEGGARFFAGLAAALGRDTLITAMSAFYQTHQGLCVPTPQFETFLIEHTNKPELAEYFSRFVYG